MSDSEFLVTIPCPRCTKQLKIRDRAYLGRLGKCPRCAHQFHLVASDASSDAPILVGEPPIQSPSPTPFPAANDPFAGLGLPSAPPIDLAQTLTRNATDFLNQQAGIGTATTPLSAPAISVLPLRRKKKRGQATIVLFLMAVGMGGIGYFVYPLLVAKSPVAMTKETNESGENRGAADGRAAVGAATKPSASGKRMAKEYLSPTSGSPITMNLLPAGVRYLVHLRPAEWWQADSPLEEVRFCLGPLADWVKDSLKAASGVEPAEIEWATIGFIPTERGQLPDLAFVFRLKQPIAFSKFLDWSGGRRTDLEGVAVYVAQSRCYYLSDDRQTLAVAPKNAAAEVAGSVKEPNPTASGLEGLLKETDGLRHLTVVADPGAVLIDADVLFPKTVQPLVNSWIEWWGAGLDALSISCHVDAQRLFNQVRLRTGSGQTGTSAEQALVRQLETWPEAMVELCRGLSPVEAGRRQIIGRFPAMCQALAMVTSIEGRGKGVEVLAPLPERAAPNLALGMLLTWDEMQREPNSGQNPALVASRAGASSGSEAGEQSVPLATRLQSRIDIDFRRTPLQDAVQYIADESKTTIEIDGDGLKLAGYTKNMTQDYKEDKIAAAAALVLVMSKYDKMCVVSDAEGKKLIVTTLPMAEQRGQKVVDLTVSDLKLP